MKGVKIGAPICEDIWSRCRLRRAEGQGRRDPAGPQRLALPSHRRRRADGAWPRPAWPRPACRWSTSTRWAARTSWSSTAAPSRCRPQGEVAMRLPMFEEAFAALRPGRSATAAGPASEAPMTEWPSGPEEIYRAMVLGLRRLREEVGLPRRAAWAFRRRRFGDHRRGGRRRPGRGQGPLLHAALALHQPGEPGGRRGLRQAPGRAGWTRSPSSRRSTPSARC